MFNDKDESLQQYHLWSDQHKLAQGIIEDETVATVDKLLYEALCQQASDIHLQPTSQIHAGKPLFKDASDSSNKEVHTVDLLVRYRVDGILYDHVVIASVKKDLILSRLKVLASLDIAQQRLAQDGKYHLVFHPEGQAARSIDIRVSTFPCLHGEKMVLRLLDRATGLLSFNELGMSETVAQSVSEHLTRLSSLLLVTGPTGSGKTTTLYSFLTMLNSSEKNIVTMEDPIEYELAGINQSQVNEQAGFTFNVGLRSMLRQDPDYLMIGEIRDIQTVSIAIEAALTGHLVLSTLHTSNASLVITRLIDMGIEPFLISASIGGILAQRLARRLCDACKTSLEPTPEMLLFFKTHEAPEISLIYKAVGCNACSGRGYKGRVGIFEWVSCDQELRDLIVQRASSQAIAACAQKNGSLFLIQDAFNKLILGLIDYEEILALGLD